MKEHLADYLLSLKNNDCVAGFALRLNTDIAKARKIAKKIVDASAKLFADEKFCEDIGMPEMYGQKLLMLRKERRATADDLLAIKAGRMNILEFYGIAEDDGAKSSYVCDSVRM